MIVKTFRRKTRNGQALVEFTLALPILLLIMLAAYFIGAAMYTGANASSALRAALQQKSTYADSENPMGDFQAQVNSYNTGTFQIPGNVVDSVTVQNQDKETAVIVAEKQVNFPLFPTFNFTVTQGLKANLIKTNTGNFTGFTEVPYNPAFPKKSAQIHPKNYKFQSNVPMYVPIDNMCSGDLSVFDTATMVEGTTGEERAQFTQTLFNDHIDHVQQLGGCGNAFTAPNDVTFNTAAGNY